MPIMIAKGCIQELKAELKGFFEGIISATDRGYRRSDKYEIGGVEHDKFHIHISACDFCAYFPFVDELPHSSRTGAERQQAGR